MASLSGALLVGARVAKVTVDAEDLMYVTVRVRPDVVAALRDRRLARPDIRDALRTIDELDLSLEPMHPGIDDPQLASYFQVDVPDQRTADRVAAKLRTSPAIEAAYVKPREEPA